MLPIHFKKDMAPAFCCPQYSPVMFSLVNATALRGRWPKCFDRHSVVVVVLLVVSDTLINRLGGRLFACVWLLLRAFGMSVRVPICEVCKCLVPLECKWTRKLKVSSQGFHEPTQLRLVVHPNYMAVPPRYWKLSSPTMTWFSDMLGGKAWERLVRRSAGSPQQESKTEWKAIPV